VDLGFRRILSSGQATTAALGRAGLERCFALAEGRLAIMPGAGVSAETVPDLQGLPLTDLHGSCSVPGRAAPLGFGAPRRTSAARVRALKAAVTQGDGGPDAQLS